MEGDLQHLEGIVGLEAQFIVFVLIAIAVALAARRIRIPFTVAMVLTGLAVSLVGSTTPLININVELEAEVILLAFLPGLLFESAYHLNVDEVRANLKPILTLAMPGVILSMGIIGGLLHFLLGLPLTHALLFGVIISATDPIAVVALFKELGVNKKLGLLVEGESLLNDGVAVVLYSILLSIALGEQRFDLVQSVGQFIITVAGGGLLGWGVGALVNPIMARNDDHLIDIAITVLVAYGTFWVAEIPLQGAVSPVIAVVVAGLLVGTEGARGGYSASSDVTIASFWEFVAFLLNSFVFLLIGLDVSPSGFVDFATPIVIAIPIILLTRVFVVYGLSALLNLQTKGSRLIPASWAHVIVWGGLRGAVSIALVLGLPADLETRPTLTTLVFAYVLFSLVIQGLTMKPLLSKLGLIVSDDAMRDYQLRRGRVATAQAASRAIREMTQNHLLPPQVAERWQEHFDTELEQRWEEMVRMDVDHGRNLSRDNIDVAEREVASQKKGVLLRLLRLGIISEGVYEQLVHEIDQRVVDDTLLPTYSVIFDDPTE